METYSAKLIKFYDIHMVLMNLERLRRLRI